MAKRGCIFETKKLKGDGITTTLKKKYVHQVLLLDTIEDGRDYPVEAAIESLHTLGWCKFDDVAEFINKETAEKLVKFCTKKNKTLQK